MPVSQTLIFIRMFFAELGLKLHDCEGEMVCKSTNEMIPYFNAPVFLENKTQVCMPLCAVCCLWRLTALQAGCPLY